MGRKRESGEMTKWPLGAGEREGKGEVGAEGHARGRWFGVERVQLLLTTRLKWRIMIVVGRTRRAI